MKLTEAINLLENHNAWRRDESDTMPEMWPAGYARNLGIAIDLVLIAARTLVKDLETEEPAKVEW